MESLLIFLLIWRESVQNQERIDHSLLPKSNLVQYFLDTFMQNGLKSFNALQQIHH